MEHGTTEPSIGARLYEAGWQQGAILRSSQFKTAHNSEILPDGNAEMQHRQVKQKECLVIVSQDCDILSRDEPYIEAFVCSVERPKRCASLIDGNSTRGFVVDRDKRLVAHATRRAIIKKELLESLTPEEWPADEGHFDRFVRWLARRYIRPAYPDEFHNAVVAPIRETLKDADEAVADLFSKAVHEIRILKTSAQGPPFDVHVTFLILQEKLETDKFDAITQIREEMLTRLNSDPQIGTSTLVPRTLDDLPASEYLASNPIYLDYFTYGGDEYSGDAEPFPPA